MLEAVQTIDSQRKSILDLQVALFVCYFILVIKNEILYHTIFFFHFAILRASEGNRMRLSKIKD